MHEHIASDIVVELSGADTQPLPETHPQMQAVQPIEAVVAGHICLDIIPTLIGDSIQLAPGHLLEAGRATLATGGPVSNTGLALHKLGVNVRLMGKVGNDLFGEAIFQIIESYGSGVSGGMVVAQGEASSYSVILSAPGMDRVIVHAPGCNNTFGADDVLYEMLDRARVFHFGYPPLMERMYREQGKELIALFKRAKGHGVTTSLDCSLPDPSTSAARADWQHILAVTLPYVDVFMPSLEEMLFMLRRPLFDELSRQPLHGTASAGMQRVELVPPDIVSALGQQLLDMGAKVVGLKVGRRGLYLRTGDVDTLMHMGRAMPANPKVWAQWAQRELWSPCFATSVVGTTGSGDATIAGFLLGLLRGMTPEATLAAACAVGACSVEAADAVGGIRSWPETLLRIADGWPRLLLAEQTSSALQMSTFGWHWNEGDELWIGQRDRHQSAHASNAL